MQEQSRFALKNLGLRFVDPSSIFSYMRISCNQIGYIASIKIR